MFNCNFTQTPSTQNSTAKSVVPVMLAPCYQVGHYNLVFALHRQPMRGARFKKNLELLICEEWLIIAEERLLCI